MEVDLKLFRGKKAKSAGTTGVSFFSDGLALVHLEVGGEGQFRLRVAESVDCAATEHALVLAQLVERHQLQNSRCVAVLGRGTYSLIQIEAPQVLAEERCDAVRWQIKDLLDYPAEQAVIDVFETQAGTQPMTFAVAAAQDKVRYVVDAVRGAHLDIQAIDIPEMVLRNVLCREPEEPRGIAFLALWKRHGLITITRGGELFMARRISLGQQDLLDAAEPVALDGVEFSQAQQNILDAIVLEIQRSLDYYESSVSRQPVAALLVAPLSEPIPGLIGFLESYLSPQVRGFELGDWLSGPQLSPAQQARCLSALGAALRSDRS